MKEDSSKYFEELKTHLPIVKDPTVIILRGHLLVEDLMDEFIAANLRDPNVIKNARLTFFQKLCIVQGIIGSSSDGHMWGPIIALNKLRNTVSHSLPDETLSQKLDPVLKAFFPENFDEIPSDIYSKSKALRKAIIFHCAMLLGYIKGIKSSKKHITSKHA